MRKPLCVTCPRMRRYLGLRGDDGHAWVSIQCPALATRFAVSGWSFAGAVGAPNGRETCYVCNQSEEQLQAAAAAAVSAAVAEPVVIDGKRCCPSCTFANDPASAKCDACGTVLDGGASACLARGGARARLRQRRA